MDMTTGSVPAAKTKCVHGAGPPAIPTSRGPAGADRLREALQASPGDAPLPRSESDGARDSGEPSTPTVRDISSVVPEPSSSAIDDGPSVASANAGSVALARPQAVVTSAESKPDTDPQVESTPGDRVSVQPAPIPPRPPARSARDAAAGIGGEPSIPRAGARTRRLRVEGRQRGASCRRAVGQGARGGGRFWGMGSASAALSEIPMKKWVMVSMKYEEKTSLFASSQSVLPFSGVWFLQMTGSEAFEALQEAGDATVTARDRNTRLCEAIFLAYSRLLSDVSVSSTAIVHVPAKLAYVKA